MLIRLGWLGLQVRSLDRAHAFYGDVLALPTVATAELERSYQVGDSQLRLRTPEAAKPGGEHAHYAFGTAYEAYEGWYKRLSEQFDLEEHSFGTYSSLYLDDPDGHCVEIGQQELDDRGLGVIFEIVLEVANLEPAEEWYRTLGFEVSGRGEERPRVRLSSDVLELELWVPHRGLAGARGGAHVDLGVVVADLDEAIDLLRPGSEQVEERSDGVRVVDGDGHHLTLLSAGTHR